jgi:aryl-alcohol dehydrogenase-like predicted oxidoreductase
MRMVTLPNTELTVSALCLGTGALGTPELPPDDAYRLLDTYVERGGNFLDTAHVYSDWIPGTKSASEKTIGAWLKRTGLRDRIVIATKGAHPRLESMHISRLSPGDIATDVQESLDYLGVDTIDLYWLHRDAPAVPVGEILDALNTHIRAGQIRSIGCSNWSVGRIQAALEYAESHGLAGFAANQPMWSLATPNYPLFDTTLAAMDDETMAFHRRTSMAVIPYSSQAQGFFSKLERGGKAALPPADVSLYYNEANVRRMERAKTLAERYDVPISRIALAYLLHQPFTVVPIVGCKTVETLEDSLAALDVPLTPEEVAYLEVPVP